MLDCKESTLAGIPESEDSSESNCCKINSNRGAILQKMMDVTLFKDPIFMMYATSNFLTSIGFNVPYVFTVVGCDIGESQSDGFITGPSRGLGNRRRPGGFPLVCHRDLQHRGSSPPWLAFRQGLD